MPSFVPVHPLLVIDDECSQQPLVHRGLFADLNSPALW